MKKTKLIAIVICTILLVNCVALFTSCSGSKPELDLKTAQENLEYYDYEVFVEHYGTSRDDVDAVMFESTLSAYNEYNDHIRICVFNNESIAKAYYDYTKVSYDCQKAYTNNEIKALEQFLKIFGDDISKDLLENLKEELDGYKEELKDLSNYIIGRSGKYVWIGTKKAIESSRK